MKLNYRDLRYLAVFALFMLLMAAYGCSTVMLPQPVAGSPPALDKTAINGIWICNLKSYPVLATRLTDASEGAVELGVLQQSESRIGLDRYKTVVRATPAGWVVSVQPEDLSTGGWFIGRVLLSSNQLFIYKPNMSVFRALVKSGRISGRIPPTSEGKESDDVALDGLGPPQFTSLQLQGIQPLSLFEQTPAATCTRR